RGRAASSTATRPIPASPSRARTPPAPARSCDRSNGWAGARSSAKRTRSTAIRRPQDDLDPAILRLTVRGRVRGDRVGLAVREDPAPPVREVRRRLLLEPRFHRERAILAELHVAVGGAGVVGVTVDLDGRAAGD